MDRLKVESYIKSYLIECEKATKGIWSENDEYVLRGAIQLFKATGEEYLKAFILRYIDEYVTATGEVQNADTTIGRVLFFAYEQTGEEKYKKAIQLLEVKLKEQLWRRGNFSTLAFYMMCETQLGKKQAYKDIVDQFHEIKRAVEEDTKHARIYFFMEILDTLEAMSEQIYEYYHELKIMFRDILKDGVPYTANSEEPFIVAATILRACRMKVLLTEKYEQVAFDILAEISEVDLANLDSKGSGCLMMAYAQLLLIK
jgi:Predicted unsaturated glucuronyl hydrolase involved in regulation of bacterial surface properties, and related proteins